MQVKVEEDNQSEKKPDISRDGISNGEIAESDVELDSSDVVEPDNDPPQKVMVRTDKICLMVAVSHTCVYSFCCCRWVMLPSK